jgi:hypothetical protein
VSAEAPARGRSLPAHRMIVPPHDAPADFVVSGRFTAPGNLRIDPIASIPQRTGIALPFVGQPLQGFSGIKPVGDGSEWVRTLGVGGGPVTRAKAG